MATGVVKLFEGQTADGQSTVYDLPLSGKSPKTAVRYYFVAAYGTFGSGTAKLQWSGDGGTTWVDVTDASFTADGHATVQLGAGQVRADLSGATSPDIDFDISG